MEKKTSADPDAPSLSLALVHTSLDLQTIDILVIYLRLGQPDAAGELVYLTADSPNTITQLEKGKVYILGGLVDRNAHKGLCFRKATVSPSLRRRASVGVP